MTTAALGRDHRALMSAHRTSRGDDPDFYPTPPWAARAMAELILRLDARAGDHVAWEPAVGAGHLAHGLGDYFPRIVTSDAYRYGEHRVFDFTDEGPGPFAAPIGWIVTNPPFNLARTFVERALTRATRGVAMIMRTGALESDSRFSVLFEGDQPLTVFAPFVERVPMHKGFWRPRGSTAAFYSVFIWIKPALRPRRFMTRIGGDWFPACVPIPPGQRPRLTRADDARLFGVSG